MKEVRAILLSVLYSACASLSELLVAIRLLLRKHQRRLRLLDLSLARFDLRLLHGNLRVDILYGSLRGSHLCARLLERDTIVAVINTGNHGPRRDVLVVGDRHLRDVARHLRSDGDLARRDEGIVGRFEIGSVVPVSIAAPCRQHEEDRANHNRDWVPAPETLARLSAAHVGWRGLLVCPSGQLRFLRLAGRALPARRSLSFRLLFQGPMMFEGTVP